MLTFRASKSWPCSSGNRQQLWGGFRASDCIILLLQTLQCFSVCPEANLQSWPAIWPSPLHLSPSALPAALLQPRGLLVTGNIAEVTHRPCVWTVSDLLRGLSSSVVQGPHLHLSPHLDTSCVYFFVLSFLLPIECKLHECKDFISIVYILAPTTVPGT